MVNEAVIMEHFRDYQIEAVSALRQSIVDVDRHSMAILPTGAGKTWIIAALAEVSHLHQVLIITPRRRLLQQTREKLLRIDFGVLASGQGEDSGENHRVIIGTVQTLLRRNFIDPDLIIIDECHLLPPDSAYSKLISRYPKAKVIGLTATPVRGSDSLESLGWQTVFNIGILELVERGWLVPPRSVATSTASGNSIFSDMQNLSEVTRLAVNNLVSAVIGYGCNKPLIFGVDIAHAKLIHDLLISLGETAFIVHSQQSLTHQNTSFLEFENTRERTWLVNVGLVTLGVDIPCVDAIVLLRDVQSFAFLAQAIGRGLRLFPGKSECLVFDFGLGTQRFGFIDRPILLANDQQYQDGHGVRFKTCPRCRSLAYINARKCDYCEHEFSYKVNIRDTSTQSKLLSRDIKLLTVSAITQVNNSRFDVLFEDQPKISGLLLSSKEIMVGDRVVVRMTTESVAVVVHRL